MDYFNSDTVTMCDCDDTLIMWSKDSTENITPGPNKIAIIDPYDGVTLYLTPHKRHIKLLNDHLERGKKVVIWSAGGAPWALAVATALGFADKDVIVMCKPSVYVDDLQCQEFMGSRIYLEDHD